MPEPSPAASAATDSSPGSDETGAEPAGAEQLNAEQLDAEPSGAEASAPLNRAARRGKARGSGNDAAAERGFGGRARPAQGRRFNPIRRTGS